jgi:hypothetical protein
VICINIIDLALWGLIIGLGGLTIVLYLCRRNR